MSVVGRPEDIRRNLDDFRALFRRTYGGSLDRKNPLVSPLESPTVDPAAGFNDPRRNPKFFQRDVLQLSDQAGPRERMRAMLDYQASVRLTDFTGTPGGRGELNDPARVFEQPTDGTSDITDGGAHVLGHRELIRELGNRRVSPESLRFLRNESLIEKRVPNKQTAYTPVWDASSSSPSLGDGTLVGYYTADDYQCLANVKLTAGAATTFGTGTWSFTVPFTAAAGGVSHGAALALDSGGPLYYAGVVVLAGGASTAAVYPHGGASAATSAVPFTWAQSDTLEFSILYPLR